jgi:hypothetical protein
MSRSKFINAILEEKYQKFKKTFDWEKENRQANEYIKAGRAYGFRYR